MPFALAFVALAAAATAPDTAGRRYHGHAIAIGNRLREPTKKHNSEVGRLDEAAFRARAAEIARELTADLRNPALDGYQKGDALRALQQIGPLAAAESPALVAALHAHDADKSSRVPYFCEVTRAMARVAPRDPAVIRALADALAGERTGGGTCHRCGCALEALAAAGPAAAEIAGPVLKTLAQGRSVAGFSQLEKTIEAVGTGPSMASTLIARATKEGVRIDDRAASLHALAKAFGELTAAEKVEVRLAAEGLLTHEYVDVRAAAADLLGAAGPPALAALVRGLDDTRYEVRASAARSLARLGPAAAPAVERLIPALDLFLGTGEAAAEALVAIGTDAQARVEERARTAPRHLRRLAEATARGIQGGGMAPVRQALAGYRRGYAGLGYIDVEVLGSGEGQTYAPNGSRITARIRGGTYTPAGAASTVDTSLTVDDAPNALFSALVGRRAGDRVRIHLSPETVPDPYTAIPKVGRRPDRLLPVATGALFEVEVTRVCEPVIWTVLKGGGIVGPIRFETHCR